MLTASSLLQWTVDLLSPALRCYCCSLKQQSYPTLTWGSGSANGITFSHNIHRMATADIPHTSLTQQSTDSSAALLLFHLLHTVWLKMSLHTRYLLQSNLTQFTAQQKLCFRLVHAVRRYLKQAFYRLRMKHFGLHSDHACKSCSTELFLWDSYS